jgi:type IV secretion system protein VirD4
VIGTVSQTPPTSGREVSELSFGDRAFVAAGVVGGALVWLVFGGAWLAARLRGHSLGVGGADWFSVLARLPSRLGDPASAWPEPARSVLPGPWLYWPCTLAAALPLAVAGWWWLRRERRRLGLERRVRLGVDAEARMAAVADLGPIVVDAATPGRFIFGTVHGRLVATEAPVARPAAANTTRARVPAYRPTRGSVMVVGPTQCGKSTMVWGVGVGWSGDLVVGQGRPGPGDVRVAQPARRLPRL